MKRAASKVFDKQPEKKHEGMAMPLALKICRVPSTVPNLPWLKQGRVFPSLNSKLNYWGIKVNEKEEIKALCHG